MPDIKRLVRLAWACYKRLKRELHDMEDAPFTLKVRMLKAEVMETLLYGFVTWTVGKEHFDELRTTHTGSCYHWLPAPTTHRLLHVVRQGPREGTIRERRDDNPQTTSPICGGRTANEQ